MKTLEELSEYERDLVEERAAILFVEGVAWTWEEADAMALEQET